MGTDKKTAKRRRATKAFHHSKEDCPACDSYPCFSCHPWLVTFFLQQLRLVLTVDSLQTRECLQNGGVARRHEIAVQLHDAGVSEGREILHGRTAHAQTLELQ